MRAFFTAIITYDSVLDERGTSTRTSKRISQRCLSRRLISNRSNVDAAEHDIRSTGGDVHSPTTKTIGRNFEEKGEASHQHEEEDL